MGRATLAAACVLALAGCGGTDAISGGVVELQLNDFTISGPSSVPATTQVLRLANDGPSVHEVVVVRDERELDELPRTLDGQRMDEDAVELVAADEFIAANESDDLAVTLAPGRYWLVCNIEGHFLGGMTAELQVTE